MSKLVRAIPPYIWKSSDIAKSTIYCGDLVSVRCKVEKLNPDASVQVSVVGSKSGGIMPRKTSLEECPCCHAKHTATTRNCSSCGESLVYFPVPKHGWKSIFASPATRLKRPAQMEKVVTNYTRASSPRDEILIEINTSLKHFIYDIVDLKSVAQLQAIEAKLIKLLSHYEIENIKKISKQQNAVLDLLSKHEMRKYEEEGEFLAYTAFLAIACDMGNLSLAKAVHEVRMEIDEVPYEYDGVF